MKLPFKYIAILVVISLAGIFAYQAYWLTSLYHTMHSEMERDITEAMRKAIDLIVENAVLVEPKKAEEQPEENTEEQAEAPKAE